MLTSLFDYRLEDGCTASDYGMKEGDLLVLVLSMQLYTKVSFLLLSYRLLKLIPPSRSLISTLVDSDW